MMYSKKFTVLLLLLLFSGSISIVSGAHPYTDRDMVVGNPEYIYPEGVSIYGYAHYDDGTIIPAGSIIVTASEHQIEQYRCIVGDNGKYGTDERKCQDDVKMYVESEHISGKQSYRNFDIGDNIYFYIHTSIMKDGKYRMCTETAKFDTNSVIFQNLTLTKIPDEKLFIQPTPVPTPVPTPELPDIMYFDSFDDDVEEKTLTQSDSKPLSDNGETNPILVIIIVSMGITIAVLSTVFIKKKYNISFK